MQQLQYEESWDKNLATKDRENIERIFNETQHETENHIQFKSIRVAINHQEALLVTVLVHNFTDNLLIFENTRLLFQQQGEAIAVKVFTIPALAIPSKVSMPWTFIFPKGSYQQHTSYENGQLKLL